MTTDKQIRKPVCLIVMDGWGVNPDRRGNAVALASTPNISRYLKEYPSTVIDTSGPSVGLPAGQMGNSEVGHLTIGAGRVIYQELERINNDIESGGFKKNRELADIIKKVKSRGSALHLMGLVSDGGVHSHMEHLYAILDAVQQAGLKAVFIHAFLDGRDTPPDSAKGYIEALQSRLEKTGAGRVATVIGRYYAMDRDNRWDRVEKAYRAMVEGEGVRAAGPAAAVADAYARGETDEFVRPAVIFEGSKPLRTISDNDGVLFFNFRADRAREITRAFVLGDFKGFRRQRRPALCGFATMTEYDATLKLPALFKPQSIENILAEILSRRMLRQFRVSETEKYAHVTFFFNGGKEPPFPGEDRFLIPSDKEVPTYDKKPEMRAFEIAKAAVQRIESGQYSFMLMNFANGDMVGHTGVLDAAVAACEAVDRAVGAVADAALKNGWAVIVTADHGNAEQMIDPRTGSPHTAHTTNLAPLMLLDDERKGLKLKESGGLEDIAPTILKIMGIEKPKEMTGEAFF